MEDNNAELQHVDRSFFFYFFCDVGMAPEFTLWVRLFGGGNKPPRAPQTRLFWRGEERSGGVAAIEQPR
jgi:hypothetical protein